jgi:hypothetical protein
MGMYTELVIKVGIIRDKPEEVDFILNFLFNPNSANDIWNEKMEIRSEVVLPDHPFFKCPRWTAVGRSNSYYHIPACCNFYDGSNLFSRSDLKDYDNEISLFLDWINPYLCGDMGNFIGWKWYEEFNEPEFLYIK